LEQNPHRKQNRGTGGKGGGNRFPKKKKKGGRKKCAQSALREAVENSAGKFNHEKLKEVGRRENKRLAS